MTTQLFLAIAGLVTTLFRLVHGLRFVNLDAEIDTVAAHLKRFLS